MTFFNLGTKFDYLLEVFPRCLKIMVGHGRIPCAKCRVRLLYFVE